MGSVHAKPRSMIKSRSTSHSNRQSSSYFISAIRGVLLALAASSLPFLIIYELPSLKFFLFEVLPSVWRCSCDHFTPKNLFVLLNVIILSIFATAHLHSSHGASGAASASSSSLQPPAHGTSEDSAVSRSFSEAFKLNDHKSADFQLGNEAQGTDERINDQPSNQYGVQKEDDRDNQASDTGSMVIKEMIMESHLMMQPSNQYGGHKDDDRDNQASDTGTMVIKEIIMETHLMQAGENGRHFAGRQIDTRKADSESKKAEKARIRAEADPESKKAGKARNRAVEDQSAPAQGKKAGKATSLRHGVQEGKATSAGFQDQCSNIDSLLSEEGSIFARAQSRPLPSARFTHKKAPKLSGLDRSLSPLKTSRPILKRGDTLDATWKAICESKRHSSPLNRHYSNHTRKAEPLEQTIKAIGKVSTSSHLSPMKQRSKIMMTSLGHSAESTQANPMYRREPSMPQEELNAKVESFISRFNEQIRIQREKSLLEYMEMVSRGSS